jgi:hypothetical protein
MATSADRMRAHRERARRGLRRLTIDVSEDDLRAIAKRGYEGAVTSDLDQQAQAVGLFLTDAAVSASDVTASLRVTVLRDDVTLVRRNAAI